MRPWPTPLDANGRVPAAITLVGSGDALLTRQGVYVVFAWKALEESGCEVEAFQKPVAGTNGGVTTPIMKNAQQRRAAVYTSSESWTPENVAGSPKRVASRSGIIVGGDRGARLVHPGHAVPAVGAGTGERAASCRLPHASR